MQPADFFSLVIEISITIVGFSGIVIVLGRRAQGEWTARDQIQLRGLLISSITAIAISGLGLLLLTTEMPIGYVWRICSVFTIGLFAFQATIGIRRAQRLLSKEFNWPATYIFLSVAIALAVLLGMANAVVIVAFWPIALLLIWLISVSLFHFIQLLWREIVEVPD